MTYELDGGARGRVDRLKATVVPARDHRVRSRYGRTQRRTAHR